MNIFKVPSILRVSRFRSKIAAGIGSVFLVLLGSAPLEADIIHDPSSSGFNSISSFSIARDFGQSFTADPSVAFLNSISFQWFDSNTTSPLPALTMQLFEGEGFGGTSLATTSLTPTTAPASYEFLAFDFSSDGISLVDGQIYSFRVTGGPGRRGAFVSSNANTFAGGQEYVFGNPNGRDLGFQVSGAAAVPEPSSLLLLVGVIGMVVLGRRRMSRPGSASPNQISQTV